MQGRPFLSYKVSTFSWIVNKKYPIIHTTSSLNTDRVKENLISNFSRKLLSIFVSLLEYKGGDF